MKAPLFVRKLIARIEAGTSGYLVQTGWIGTRATRSATDSSGNSIPWFTYPAISFLAARTKREWRVLEYGSGASTIWWTARCEDVVAVEHHADWAAHVKKSSSARVLIPDDQSSGKYVSLPDSLGPFDVVVVDGLHREDCLAHAESLLVPSGVVVLDDAQRPEYAAAIEALKQRGFRSLEFHGPQPVSKHPGCTTIFYRSSNCLAI